MECHSRRLDKNICFKELAILDVQFVVVALIEKNTISNSHILSSFSFVFVFCPYEGFLAFAVFSTFDYTEIILIIS